MVHTACNVTPIQYTANLRQSEMQKKYKTLLIHARLTIFAYYINKSIDKNMNTTTFKKAWLMVLAMAIMFVSACNEESDEAYDDPMASTSAFSNNSFTGSFLGEWSLDFENHSTQYAYWNISTDGEIKESLKCDGYITLTSDSIVIPDIFSKLFVAFIESEMHKGQDSGLSKEFGSIGNTSYRSPVMEIGNGTRTHYLTLNKTSYQFKAYARNTVDEEENPHFDTVVYDIIINMRSPGVCVINEDNHSIIIEFILKEIKTNGLSGGGIQGVDSEVELTFSEEEPVTLRFTSRY